MKIIGIDPGLQRTGWGVIEKTGSSLRYIDCGTIQTNADDALDLRLKYIHTSLVSVIQLHAPANAAIEETFVSVNGSSTLKLGQARGAIIVTLAICNLPVAEYSATHVKKAVVGTGRAEKSQVEAMIKILLPGAKATKADAYDALAIAVCHANTMRYNGK